MSVFDPKNTPKRTFYGKIERFKANFSTNTPTLLDMYDELNLTKNWKRDLKHNNKGELQEYKITAIENLRKWVEKRLLSDAFIDDRNGTNRMKYWEKAYNIDYSKVDIDDIPTINVQITKQEELNNDDK